MQMKSAVMNLNPSSAQIVNSQMQQNQQQQQQQWPIVNVQLRNEPITVRPTSPMLKVANNNRESLGYGQSKGLLNGPGQNNCFLNCAVQVSEKEFIVEMEPLFMKMMLRDKVNQKKKRRGRKRRRQIEDKKMLVLLLMKELLSDVSSFLHLRNCNLI